MIHNIFFFILSYDIWFYVSHILLHKINVLKKMHKEHHNVDYQVMNFTQTYVAHFIETPFQGVGILFPLLFIQWEPVSFFHSILIIQIRGMLKHDSRFIWLISNHHILHHKYPRYNYGEYWLDKLFGTLYPDSREHIRGLICV